MKFKNILKSSLSYHNPHYSKAIGEKLQNTFGYLKIIYFSDWVFILSVLFTTMLSESLAAAYLHQVELDPQMFPVSTRFHYTKHSW